MRPSLFALLILSATLCAQDNTNLPVKRVVLYKNGVGYFEHVGQVRDKQDVTVQFTSGELNDVLKSLTVLDLDGGRITGVAYGSSAPIERQLGDLHMPAGERTSLSEFLGGLRGARLEIHSGPAIITGRLLSVERKARVTSGTTEAVDYVSLITDRGMKRCLFKGRERFEILVGAAVLANNLMRIADLLANRKPNRRRAAA